MALFNLLAALTFNVSGNGERRGVTIQHARPTNQSLAAAGSHPTNRLFADMTFSNLAFPPVVGLLELVE